MVNYLSMEGNCFTPTLTSGLKRAVPGYQAILGIDGIERLFECGGNASLIPDKIPVTGETLFDCASLTKPLITAALTLHLVREEVVALDQSVPLPSDFKPFPFGLPTIRQLLEHRSGMPAWAPLTLLGPPERVPSLLPALQRCSPGGQTVYSCLGFILLGFSLAYVSGLSLPSLAQKNLFTPLGIGQNAFFPLPGKAKIVRRCAATERGNVTEREMTAGGVPPRPSPIRGEVHDGNAFHLGGAAGNAGLFATARAVMELGFHLLSLLPERRGDQGPYFLGLHTSKESTLFPGGYFGHTGFTGTLLLLHPKRSVVAALLTNGIHAHRPPDLLSLRRFFISTCQNLLNGIK